VNNFAVTGLARMWRSRDVIGANRGWAAAPPDLPRVKGNLAACLVLRPAPVAADASRGGGRLGVAAVGRSFRAGMPAAPRNRPLPVLCRHPTSTLLHDTFSTRPLTRTTTPTPQYTPHHGSQAHQQGAD
jgi:hypothetical protein